MSYIAAFGGANMDTHILSHGKIRLRDSNPSSVSFSAGGVARNIAENLASLGVKTVFLGAVGRDANGDGLIKYTSERGVDMSHVLVSEKNPTSSYIAFIEPGGEMFAAANAMGITDELDEKYIEERSSVIENASCVVTDANCSPAAIKKLCETAAKASVPVIADATSMAKAPSLLPSIGMLRLLKCNIDELETLSKTVCGTDEKIKEGCAKLLSMGLYSVAVTLGKRGCYYAGQDGTSFFASLAPLGSAADTTGCGDAFCAGAAFGIMNGDSAGETMASALAMGRLTAKTKSTINTGLSIGLVKKEIEENEFRTIY